MMVVGISKAFCIWSVGRDGIPPYSLIFSRKPLKALLIINLSFHHAIPAYIPSMRSAGIKWVSGYPENYKRGLPYITGLLILNDVETGIPYAVMDCIWITAMRTAAASALAAKYLARPESETVGILACGVQGVPTSRRSPVCSRWRGRTLTMFYQMCRKNSSPR